MALNTKNQSINQNDNDVLESHLYHLMSKYHQRAMFYFPKLVNEIFDWVFLHVRILIKNVC